VHRRRNPCWLPIVSMCGRLETQGSRVSRKTSVVDSLHFPSKRIVPRRS